MSSTIYVEKCANCGAPIGALETPHVWNDNVVCARCYPRLFGSDIVAGRSNAWKVYIAIGVVAALAVVLTICTITRRTAASVPAANSARLGVSGPSTHVSESVQQARQGQPQELVVNRTPLLVTPTTTARDSNRSASEAVKPPSNVPEPTIESLNKVASQLVARWPRVRNKDKNPNTSIKAVIRETDIEKSDSVIHPLMGKIVVKETVQSEQSGFTNITRFTIKVYPDGRGNWHMQRLDSVMEFAYPETEFSRSGAELDFTNDPWVSELLRGLIDR